MKTSAALAAVLALLLDGCAPKPAATTAPAPTAAPTAGASAEAGDGSAASVLEHILDRTVVIINNTPSTLYFSVKLPNEDAWNQYPASPNNSQGIYCPTCDEDSDFKFYMATTTAPISRTLKANYRYMIVAGPSNNWEVVQGPALH
ncbi:hypothetical protein [Limobrevibacterium gyesilva]|uniref:Lipoprotein n=1 Tax=Limobrevibacterium gyesilva TaxID=2991712 RepID=A0AA41YNI3_9PROT|nr:hypothetical protein [Limobrevibacterium gyesilva]MCW3477179.1 hypothetical protein [Limobrevibacterium gyesilva]